MKENSWTGAADAAPVLYQPCRLKANRLVSAAIFGLLWMVSCSISIASAQGTTFTYQGRLNANGSPANGVYDMTFALFSTSNGPSPLGAPITHFGTTISNGLFSVPLDFGGNFPGSDRWLEISVRTNGGTLFDTLSPRQPITPTPYAIFAGSVLPGGLGPGAYASELILNNASNSFSGTFTGNGAKLYGVQASSWVKIISPTAPLNGDTNWFGPWTPGTRTAGIQEAINSLAIPDNPKSPGGGKIIVSPGTYYTFTNIAWPTTNAFFLTLEGSGMLSSGIVYAGPNPQNVMNVGIAKSINGAHVHLSDLFIASCVNACTNIVFFDGVSKQGGAVLGGVGEADIERCWFGYWPTMTNSPVFSPDSPGLFTTTHRNLIGLNIQNNYGSRIVVRDCAFEDCIGLSYANDQGAIIGNLFIACGIDTMQSLVNDWPATSPYKSGFACYLVDPIRFVPTADANNDSWRVDGNRFVIAPRTYFYDQWFKNPKASFNDFVEGNSACLATTGGKWTFVNPKGQWTYYHVTNTTDFSKWNLNPAPTNMVTEVRFDGGLSLKNGNYFGNGRGITNIGASGSAQLISGTSRVSTAFVKFDSKILLTYNSLDGSVAMVYYRTNDISPGAGFTIRSSSATDSNMVEWFIIP